MRFRIRPIGAALLLAAICATPAVADDWPQWLGPRRDSVWREEGVLDRFPAAGPKFHWRVKVGGGYSGPAVAGGRVYVTDYVTPGDTRVDDGGQRTRLGGKERVLCFREADGELLWEHPYECTYSVSYPCGPRCTPTVGGGKVYTLGTMGNLLCLDASTGKNVWAHDFKRDYGAKVPLWGFAGHPLLDGDRLICVAGGKDAVVVAFHKDTGKELWRALSAAEPGYSSPIIFEAGGKRQLIVWHAESVNGLDPVTGKPYWSVPLPATNGAAIMTPRRLGELLFLGGFDRKAALLRLAADRPAAEVVYRGTRDTALYPVNSTPFLEDGHLYGVDGDGELRCVRLADGKRLWGTPNPVTGRRKGQAGTAFLVKHGGRFFLFTETGDLIVARLNPSGYEEVCRARLLAPTGVGFGREVVWSHPAFAGRCVFARNDKELVCVSLAAGTAGE